MTFFHYYEQISDGINGAIAPIIGDMNEVAQEIDEVLDAGEEPEKETIDAMFHVAGKIQSVSKFLAFLSIGIRNSLKEIINRYGLEEEDVHQEEEQKQEPQEIDILGRIRDIGQEARAISLLLSENEGDEEAASFFNEFADYVDSTIDSPEEEE